MGDVITPPPTFSFQRLPILPPLVRTCNVFRTILQSLMTFKSIVTPQIFAMKNLTVESIHEFDLFLEVIPVDHNNTNPSQSHTQNSSLNKDFYANNSNREKSQTLLM